MAGQVRTEIRNWDSGAFQGDKMLSFLMFGAMCAFFGGLVAIALFHDIAPLEQTVCKERLMTPNQAEALCLKNGFDNGGFLTMDSYGKHYKFSVLCSKSDGSIKSFGVD